MKKKVIKRKIKYIPVLLFILAIVLIYFLVKVAFDFKIQNIYIINNNNLSDEYIIKKAELSDYPSYFGTFKFSLENKLEKDVFIEYVSISKHFFGVVNIEVEENDVLFYNEINKKYVLEDKQEVDSIPYKLSPIRLIPNEKSPVIPEKVYDELITKISKLDNEIKSKISQIKYDPSEYDEKRFLLYMVDGNYVYTTLPKFKSVNYYNEIYPTLEGKKGILYLDSGNHFQEIK